MTIGINYINRKSTTIEITQKPSVQPYFIKLRSYQSRQTSAIKPKGVISPWLLIIILLIITLYYIFINDNKNTIKNNLSINNTEIETPTPEDNPTSYEIGDYLIVIKNISKMEIKVIPNFSDKKTSVFINENYKCDFLINGGFYEENRNPLGLYYLNNNFYGALKQSQIYNGVLSIDKDNNWDIFEIDEFTFESNAIFYMQSGPLIKYNGIYENISTNLSKARRIIFFQDDKDNSYILLLVNFNDFNNGPELNVVKDILEKISEKSKISIIHAINLDGGNASLYIDKNYSIKESLFAGSFLCFNL